MRRSFPPFRLVLVPFAVITILALAGCGGMWDSLRENERGFALDNARNQSKRGKCVEALAAVDRAEAIMLIDRFAIEANQIRIRCYEKLGLSELQFAHRRLVEDYYTEEPMAFPAADGSSIFRASGNLPAKLDRPPSWLEILRPRYSKYAQRSKIVGRVVVQFGLAEGGKARKIRILEMPHPLLASWAIEAVAQAKPKRKGQVPVIESDRSYVTTFNFEWRWANE